MIITMRIINANMNKTTARELLQSLVDLDLTQKQIEAGAGINQPSISRILNGSQADVSYAAGKRLEAFVAQMTSIDKQAA
ncbi:hypothetical protein PROAA_610009 [Candidatus Propionivibrio aalborgensis]|uniref:HTH cro/C1-type domain-containing protein n=1 Tax=Candidatus Propionivibrio aalborgensis TaxID=1860101 RepID=A0A1A8Y0F8_9RHOO|nr:hypothetical protein PROAA_610009 [Candidatus Propionivibrio aalborgensis]